MQDTRQTDFKSAIQDALAVLHPQFGRIDSHWRKLVHGLSMLDRDVKLVSELNFPAETAHLRSGRLEPYRLSLERKARDLERLGVPERSAVASLGLYLESCLPYVRGEQATERIAALCRATAVAQLFVMSGYSSRRALSWREIEEHERHRLSRDLHDEVGHSFLVLKLYLEMMALDLQKNNMTKLQHKLDEALTLVSQGIDSVRRLVLDLGPALLDELGLIPALKMYAGQFESRTGIKVVLKDSQIPRNLPSAHETVMYRVIQGALSNVLQHARATRVNIGLTKARGPLIMLTIEDDGIGFDVTRLKSRQAFGLTAIRERVEGLGGRFRLESWRRASRGRKRGTRIGIEIPWRRGKKRMKDVAGYRKIGAGLKPRPAGA